MGEVQSLSVKAARGAGMEWGLAEEAGMATRWLCGFGLPGVELLSDLLRQQADAVYEELCPQTNAWPWYANGGKLCPLITGATICDRADVVSEDEGFALLGTACPLLLVPFIGSAAKLSGKTMRVSWQHVVVYVSAIGVTVEGDMDLLLCSHTPNVAISHATSLQGDEQKQTFRAEPSEGALRGLERLAQRTYAPETEKSRLSGAGAGLTDND
ncbi:MAG: DUF3726 domain-containing protein [Pseudomonadota bacterium]